MEFRRGLFRSVRRSAAKRVSRREPICGPAVATWADATPAPLGTNQPEGSYSGEDGIDRWVSDEDEEADEEEHHGQRHLLGLGLGFGLLRSHGVVADRLRSEEHTSELQSLMRISYAVFCLKKKNKYKNNEK